MRPNLLKIIRPIINWVLFISGLTTTLLFLAGTSKWFPDILEKASNFVYMLPFLIFCVAALAYVLVGATNFWHCMTKGIKLPNVVNLFWVIALVVSQIYRLYVRGFHPEEILSVLSFTFLGLIIFYLLPYYRYTPSLD